MRVDYTYTDRNERKSMTRFSDLAGTTKVGDSSYTFDAGGRLTNLQNRTGTSAVIGDYAYQYDLDNRLTQKTENGVSTSFAYDKLGQVTSANGKSLSYDATGNRTNSGYVTAGGNRVTSDGTWTYSYDLDGNQVGKSKAGESWSYAYDHRGQMTQAASDTGVSVTYKFDAFGNRIERDATVGGVSSVEKFVVDGWDTTKPRAVGTENFDAILDLDGAGTVTNRRLFGSGFDDVVGRQDASGSVKWYATDRLGSVRQVFDNAGNVSGTTDYDAFGGFLGGVSVDRYAFTGREADVALGLQYSRGRMYDSATGRWMGEDPIRTTAGDANLYRYVGNGATNARDPSGHDDDEFDFFKLRKKVIPPSEAFQKTIDNLRKALEEQKEGGKLTKEQEQAISFYVLDVAEGQGTSILTPEQDKLLQQMLKSGIADKKHVEAILAVVTKQSMESAFERFKSYEMHGGRPVLQPPPNGSFSHTCTGGYGTIHGLIRGGGNTVPYEVWKKWLPQQPQEKPPSFSDTSALGRLQWAMARGIQEIPNEFAGQLKDLINNKEFKEAVALAALGALMLQLIPGAGQATNSAVFGFIFVRLVATVGYAAATAGLAEGIQKLAIYVDLALKAKNVEELELAAEAFAKAMIAFSGSVGASKAFSRISAQRTITHSWLAYSPSPASSSAFPLAGTSSVLAISLHTWPSRSTPKDLFSVTSQIHFWNHPVSLLQKKWFEHLRF